MTKQESFKLGIITASYNRPSLLTALHESIVKNSGAVRWCHYVVNDGSNIDYSEAKAICNLYSDGRLKIKKIANSGVLIARNLAIEIAIADGVTHLCFIDDDDLVINNGVEKIEKTIARYQDKCWFLFKSKKDFLEETYWPSYPVEFSWFNDIVLNGCLGSDNLIVLSVNFLGKCRFSQWGRNQREWVFLMKLSKKNDFILVCPDVIIKKNYHDDGLTAETKSYRYKPMQIFNSIHRAFVYWTRKPSSFALFFKLCRHIFLSPLKLFIYYIERYK